MTRGELLRFVSEQITDWLTAIGTVGAVIVSLYLARRDARVSLEVAAGHRIAMPASSGGPIQEYLMLSAVNVGRRPATIAYVGWRFGNYGRFGRVLSLGARFAVQLLDQSGQPKIPVTLQDGERWTYLHPFGGWAKTIQDDVLKKSPTIRKARTIHVHVVTSTGAHFIARIESGLQKRLVQFAKGEPFRISE